MGGHRCPDFCDRWPNLKEKLPLWRKKQLSIVFVAKFAPFGLWIMSYSFESISKNMVVLY
jgi:hypothetical protein